MSKNVSNNPIINARLSNNDEFYTLIEDIDKELSYYSERFKNKTENCNCDY